MSKTLLSAFNNTLDKFSCEIISTYPQEKEFVLFKNAIKLVQKVNPRKVLSLFIEYIDPYKVKILEKDESFFLNANYSNVISKANANKKNAWNLIDRIKVYWKDMSDTNKEVMWNYFIVLITLSYKYCVRE